ncbi:MAG: hypothetical protein CSA34_02895 [Desulfobulbus propionicus]|nr:MAG: hypothetical protein CSA34_02895 [Desulfobulbus propionicus]
MDSPLKYHRDRLDVSVLTPNNIDRLQLEMIPRQSRVLEVGCATGYMSEYLESEKGCEVYGVELDAGQAGRARERGLDVLTGSIDDPEVQEKLGAHVREKGPFDVVFMSQVIEHLARPEDVLLEAREWLGSSGLLVISTCNVAHWRVRFALLRGRWQYTDFGILDRDHLRFFTMKSFARLLEECGYEPVDFAFSFEDFCPFKLLFDFRLLAPSDVFRCLPGIGMPLRRRYLQLTKGLVATQFVYAARPK